MKLKEKENVEVELIKARKEILIHKKNELQTLKKKKKELDKATTKKITFLKTCFILSLIFSTGIIALFIILYDWNILERYTYLLSFLPFLFLLIYSLSTEKTFNILSILKTQKLKIRKNVFKDFDDNEIDNLSLEIQRIENSNL